MKPFHIFANILFPSIFSLSVILKILVFTNQANAVPAPTDEEIKAAFQQESIQLQSSQISAIRGDISTALEARCTVSPTGGNSKVGFAAVQIASNLDLNLKTDSSLVERIKRAVEHLPCTPCREGERCGPPPQTSSWDDYFNKTIGLNSDSDFLKLLSERSFHPVKISWEDIGRYEGSVWGDRISDVGIWVRRVESDPASAELALSVRRDSNFRDKVLVVPAEKIKIHLRSALGTKEVSLPERLKELGLSSQTKDSNVIVSNQFAIVPVPAKGMSVAGAGSEPPRAAFTFSIFPYGSTNFVITDVIEGSSDAIVGPGTHQLLFSNIDGKRAPFTASRAEERQDLLALEKDLKARGMDVDVQRYYLIQIPLRKGAADIQLSNMGTPPFQQHQFLDFSSVAGTTASEEEKAVRRMPPSSSPGLGKVAIGHGEIEGDYSVGSGYRGNRAEEPIRVTVVYFVTPIRDINRSDMDTFTSAFSKWDEEALWGGSFVVKE